MAVGCDLAVEQVIFTRACAMLRRLAMTPTSNDPTHDVRSAIAQRIVLGSLPVMFLGFAFAIVTLAAGGSGPIHYIPNLVWLASLLLSAGFAWRRRWLPAAAALCLGLAAVSGAAVIVGSVHSLGFVGNAVLMALVVPLFGPRWGWVLFAWAVITGAMWLILYGYGVVSPPQLATDLQAYAFTCLVLVLMQLVLLAPTKMLTQALVDADARLDELQRAREEERRAAQALHETSTQLARARRLEALGRLSGGVAHDFNNMLGAIMGATDLLALELPPGDNPELDANLELLRQATKRASLLTRKLLAFGGQDRLHGRRVDINKLVRDVELLCHASLGSDVELELELDDAPLFVSGDQVSLEQALFNLVLNARDAMPGGGKITISTHERELDDQWCEASDFDIAPGPAVEIRVRDTGTGIPLEVRARLFEPFFTTKPVGRGTGLGLSAVHGTVVGHRGVIEVDSEIDRGTVFHLYLPLDTSSDSQRGSAVARHDGLLFVAEDDELSRRAIEGLLRGIGYEVRSFAGGAALLDALADGEQPVAVLSDVMMPDLDGPTLAASIAERYPELPVILMSGFVPESLSSQLARVPKIPLLRKPFGEAELLAALARGVRRTDATIHSA